MKPQLPSWARPFYTTPSRYKIAYGGRGSSKSWSMVMMIIMLCNKQKLRVLCTREIQMSIKASVKQLIMDVIIRFGWVSKWTWTTTEVRNIETGSVITFAGLKNNPESVKSTEGIDICFIEEAQTISESSMRLLIPSIRKPNSEIWMAMNPRFEADYCYQRFIITGGDNVLGAKVNFYENPFFPDVLREEMEYDKKVNHAMYLHTWLGELRPYGERPLFATGQLERVRTGLYREPAIYGLDLSYSGKNALTGISVTEDGHELHISETASASGVPVQKMSEWLGAIDKAIVYDNARPEIGQLLRDQGYTALASRKGAGSIIRGADKMARFHKIYFYDGTDDAYDEFSRLGWNEREEVTGDRDYWDATRYAMEKIQGEMTVIPWHMLTA